MADAEAGPGGDWQEYAVTPDVNQAEPEPKEAQRRCQDDFKDSLPCVLRQDEWLSQIQKEVGKKTMIDSFGQSAPSHRVRAVAAPEYGTFAFMGRRTGRIYNVDIYYSDVADGLINFDGGAGASATSPTSFTCPEDVILADVAIVTGGTDTKKLQILRNNQPTGDFLRHTQHLTTLATRSPIRLGFRQGTEVRAIQKA